MACEHLLLLCSWPVARVDAAVLLTLPFSARVVRPDAVSPVWLCKPKRRVKGVQRERDLTGMPVPVPATELPVPEQQDDQYLLPELVGAMFDSTVLAGDAIRVVADTWCRHALDGLHRACRVVRPLALRDAAERDKEPKLLRGLRLHWRREMLMSG
jgi:hypothetical protein